MFLINQNHIFDSLSPLC